MDWRAPDGACAKRTSALIGRQLPFADTTPRTVQCIEVAQPSNLNTRRALARAIGTDEIYRFNQA